ncbi:hypothetical protein UlMin_028641 [Ulmus minor]
MAEEILFGIAEEIILKLGEQAVKEIGLIWGVKTELRKLEKTVETIRAVLLDAEEKQADAQIKIWLENLADAVYDADNVVDEFRYRQLRRRLVFGNKRAKKVRIFFSRLNQIQANRSFHLEKRLEDKRSFMRPVESYSFVMKDEVIGRDDDEKAIKELLLSDFGTKKNVSTIAIVGIGGLGKTTLAQLIFNDDEVKKCFERNAWVCVSDVFDVKLLVQKIIRSVGGTSPDPNLDLEQLQTELRSHIEGKKYLLVLDDVWNEKSAEWDKLAMLLQSGASGSRILITTRSEKVATATRTTRTYQLRGLDEGESLYLFRSMAFEEGKQPADNWGLAEIEREIVDKCKGVPLAIKSIATLLRSRLIHSQDPEKEWKLFKRSELAEIANEDESDIIPTLRLSYRNLPSHLKHCFAFCRLFPKDHKIDVAKLIRLWIAQGFIKPSENRQLSLKDVGREYFVDLLWRSFFQEAIKDELGNITSCKMHDLIHDLAISVAGKGVVTLDQSKDNTQRMGSSGSGTNTKNVHHAYAEFRVNESRQIPEFWLEQKKLRSLALSNLVINPNLDVVVSNFKFLRSLSLIRLNLEILPDKVGELIHLRYLDLSFNRKIKVLPASITRLHHLETLILEDCRDLERLPQDMKKLVSLRRLELSGCWRLTHTPRGIGELTSLQTLSLFKVVDDNNDQLSSQCARLGELSGLNNLHGELRIELWGHKKDVASESKAAKLKDKEQLQSLYLSWQARDVEDMNNDGMALDGFQPAQTLKALHVEFYMGSRISDWLSSLTRLVRLDLTNCENCQYIPPLHHLSSLQILRLFNCHAIEYISEMDEDEFSASMASSTSTNSFFPSLRQLTIICCENLKGWWRNKRSGDIAHHKPGQPSFPNLSDLCLRIFRQLNSLPLFPNVERVELDSSSSKPLQQTITSASSSTSPSKLSRLEIESVVDVESLLKLIDSLSSLQCLRFRTLQNLRVLPEELGKLRSLQTLTITDLPSLESLPEGMSNLSSLQSLCIWACSSLVSLPNEIGNLSSLQSFHIERCSSLVSLPNEIGNLSSLQSLHIEKCSSLVSLPNEIGNLSSLQSLHISGCSSLVSLPNEIGNLSSLQSLKISGCSSLVSLPNEIGNLSSLQSLRIKECSSLVSLPNEIGNLSSLQSLKISGCSSLVSLPNEIGNLSSLQSLRIEECSSLVSLPNEIGNLSSLQSLRIEECSSLVSLPNEIGNLSSLQSLHIEKCSSLVSLPNEIGNLSSLQTLDIWECSSLVSLPNEISNLSSLQFLNIWECSSLVSLPNEIGNLSSL